MTNYRVAIFGLGYVGCISLACLAKLGHRVVGVDINPYKVDLVNQGRPTIVESNVESLMEELYSKGQISASSNVQAAIAEADLSMICVGTPSMADGHPNLGAMWHVAQQIGEYLHGKVGFHTIAIRSTVPPGTCRQVEEIIANSSKRVAEEDFTVVSNPEFLREGTGVYDYFHPPHTVIGTQNAQAIAVLRNIYGSIDAPIFEVQREVAEIIKYVGNSFHALKVVFANEIGAICQGLGIDSHQVMKLLCEDYQLNISPAYLMPGFAFGGSCLPKDLRAMNAMARGLALEVPVLASIAQSNMLQIKRALSIITGTGKRCIGVLGLAFKPDTDDTRESPVVELLEHLLGKGFELIIHDRNVSVSMLVGANKEYIESRLPHLTRSLVHDINEVRQKADVVVVTQKTAEYQNFVSDILDDKIVIDLVRLFDELPDSENYHGIGW